MMDGDESFLDDDDDDGYICLRFGLVSFLLYPPPLGLFPSLSTLLHFFSGYIFFFSICHDDTFFGFFLSSHLSLLFFFCLVSDSLEVYILDILHDLARLAFDFLCHGWKGMNGLGD
jgi:hypothetical protein